MNSSRPGQQFSGVGQQLTPSQCWEPGDPLKKGHFSKVWLYAYMGGVISPCDSNAKQISHTCFISADDDKVLTFAMQSPSPVKTNPLTVGDLASASSSSAPTEASEFAGYSYDADFLREIEGLELDSSISEDVIPTIFYTPGYSKDEKIFDF